MELLKDASDRCGELDGPLLSLARRLGNLVAAIFGSCNELYPTIVRAELRAIEEALRRAVAPITVYTDNAEVVTGYQRGSVWCSRANRDGADILIRIWKLIDEVGEVRLCKVKAHATSIDVEEGRITQRLQAGNAAADHFAVLARLRVEESNPTDQWLRHDARARQWD